MKTLALVCLCLFVSKAFGSALPLAMQYVTECKALEDPESSELRDTCRDGAPEENPSEELKCFYKCVLEKNNILENGYFSSEFKLSVDLYALSVDTMPFPKPRVDQLLHWYKKCTAVSGTNPCDLAYNYVKCAQPVLLCP